MVAVFWNHGLQFNVKYMLNEKTSYTCLFAFSKLLYWVRLKSSMKLFNNLDIDLKLNLFKMNEGML